MGKRRMNHYKGVWAHRACRLYVRSVPTVKLQSICTILRLVHPDKQTRLFCDVLSAYACAASFVVGAQHNNSLDRSAG